MPGLKMDPKPSFELSDKSSEKDLRSEFGDSETSSEISKNESPSSDQEGRRISGVATSFLSGDFLDQKPGWPLLLRAASGTAQVSQARNMSLVHWVMSLPDRPPHHHSQSGVNLLDKQLEDILGESSNETSSDLGQGLEVILGTNPPSCKWFTYDVLQTATSNFSSENLIGKGGCNRVYKGIMPDGKAVAVKVSKSSKEARKDFAREVRIISLLKHERISPLLGICMKDNYLISVYNFSSKGSLEENLQVKHKDKHVLSWRERFSIAVGIAEALDYLHNECSCPVIHRDVKSSNILLSDGYEPQLSDFGLAMYGPTSSSFLIQCDVVGTFGYLAPEYFMYGKVSDKIDVYAYGVVLLELLSGRNPISTGNPKGQASLVMWAKPMIESGDAEGLLDPNLTGMFDEAQLQRTVVAVSLCLTRAARLRPKIREILRLLRGDNNMEKWMNNRELEHSENQQCNDDDEVYPNSSAELHLSLALLGVDDDSASMSSLERSQNSLSSSSSSD